MPIKDNNSDPSRARSIGKILLLVAGTFLLLNLLSSLLLGAFDYQSALQHVYSSGARRGSRSGFCGTR